MAGSEQRFAEVEEEIRERPRCRDAAPIARVAARDNVASASKNGSEANAMHEGRYARVWRDERGSQKQA